MLDFAVCAAMGAQKESDPSPKGDDTIKGDKPPGDKTLRLMHSGKFDQHHPVLH